MRDTAWRLGHRPELDGLRGVAILLVLCCHLLGTEADGDGGASPFHALGSAGVTVFFTLSGFLITCLVVEEAGRGRVSLARFYRNRAVRLFPALAAVVVVLVLLQWVLDTPLVAGVPAVLLYVGNWAHVHGTNLGLLNVTWSLSIEEQFYLVWPLLLVVSLRWRRGPVTVAVLGIAASTVARFALWPSGGGERVFYGSDTEAASLLVGCLLALVAAGGLPRLVVPPWTLGASSVALFAWAWAAAPVAGDVLVPTLLPWVTAVLIWACCCSPGGALSWSPLRYLGRRAYGLYLWHGVVLWLVLVLTRPSLLWGLVAVLVSVGVAELSWVLVERPLQALRAGRTGSPVRTADPPARAPATPGRAGVACGPAPRRTR